MVIKKKKEQASEKRFRMGFSPGRDHIRVWPESSGPDCNLLHASVSVAAVTYVSLNGFV